MAHLNVETINLPEQQAYAASAFPLLLSAAQVAGKSAISHWIAEHRDYIEDQLALTGAILFRGFGLVNDRDFDDFIRTHIVLCHY